MGLEVGRGADTQGTAADVKSGVVGVGCTGDETVGEGVPGIRVGRAESADDGVSGDVLVDARVGKIEVRGRLVGIGDRDGEGLLEGRTRGILGLDENAVARLRLEIGADVELERVADDEEVGIVGIAGARDQRVGEGIACIRIDRREGANRGSGGVVLLDAGGRQGDVGGSLVQVVDCDGEHILIKQPIRIRRPHADGVAILGLIIRAGGQLQGVT